MAAFVTFEDVSKVYHSGEIEIRAVDHISFTIEKGEFCVIVGPSGAGKTTVLNMLGGMDACSGGTITVDGTLVSGFNARQLTTYRRHDIGFVFQFYNLVGNLTALENVELAAQICKDPLDAATVLNEVGLSARANNFPGQLSGGEQQRVAIARALANKPRVLLSDEATSALDPKTTDSILDLLKKINETLHITIVIITHEMNVIQKICNKVAVMDFGKVVETGSVIQVFSDPQSDIAKRFVGNLIRDVIPEPLVESIRRETRNSRLLRIKLENTDSTEPLLWDINRRFEVETNILYSTINVIQGIVVGIMLVLFIGSDEEIKKAERYILESNEEYKEVVLP